MYCAQLFVKKSTKTVNSATEYIAPDSMIMTATGVSDRDRKTAEARRSVSHILKAIRTVVSSENLIIL